MLNWNFPEEWGFKLKNLQCGIFFWNCTIDRSQCFTLTTFLSDCLFQNIDKYSMQGFCFFVCYKAKNTMHIDHKLALYVTFSHFSGQEKKPKCQLMFFWSSFLTQNDFAIKMNSVSPGLNQLKGNSRLILIYSDSLYRR